MMSSLNAEAHICQADGTVAAVGTLQQHQESDSSHSMCDEDDKECMATDSDQAVYFYNYHIVYLPSYNVPVLLFNGRCAGERLLSLSQTACSATLLVPLSAASRILQLKSVHDMCSILLLKTANS